MHLESVRFLASDDACAEGMGMDTPISPNPDSPLADRMRPRHLSEIIGQDTLVGEAGVLTRSIRGGSLGSLLLVGPPGSGKTTIGRLLADAIGARFEALSATADKIADLRTVAIEAKKHRADGMRTLLFLDEIHRFTRVQQDALLPLVEDGTLILVGATTENPYAVAGPLLSRLTTLRLTILDDAAVGAIIERALVSSDGLADRYDLSDDARRNTIGFASGDARRALSILDAAATLAAERMVNDSGEERTRIEVADVVVAAQTRVVAYDRSGVISAFIKSIRGNDPDAALVWLAVMLSSDEDPRFIARRLCISASEDIGNADPTALPLATAALAVVESIGLPEATYALAQATTYLASTVKSPRAGEAFAAASEAVAAAGPIAVPPHLRASAKTYRSPHTSPPLFDVAQPYLPRVLAGRRFYDPAESGIERRLAERLTALREARARNPG